MVLLIRAQTVIRIIMKKDTAIRLIINDEPKDVVHLKKEGNYLFLNTSEKYDGKKKIYLL